MPCNCGTIDQSENLQFQDRLCRLEVLFERLQGRFSGLDDSIDRLDDMLDGLTEYATRGLLSVKIDIAALKTVVGEEEVNRNRTFGFSDWSADEEENSCSETV